MRGSENEALFETPVSQAAKELLDKAVVGLAAGAGLGPVSAVEAHPEYVTIEIDPDDGGKTAVLGRWMAYLTFPRLVLGRRTRTAREVRLNLQGMLGDARVIVYTTFDTVREADQVALIEQQIEKTTAWNLLRLLAGDVAPAGRESGRRR